MSAAQPLPGPLDVDPTAVVYDLVGPIASWAVDRYPARDLARAMLDAALADVQMGAFDRRIVEWLKDSDVPTIATVASLLRRAFEAGAMDGAR